MVQPSTPDFAKQLFSRIIMLMEWHAPKLAFTPTPLSDLVSRYLHRNSEDDYDEDSVVAALLRAFTHIPSNPSSPALTGLILESYSFTHSSTTGHVNASSASAAVFLARVVSQTKHQRSDRDSHIPLSSAPVFILRGPRGAGKTFFLNYLSSRFNRVLSSVRTVLVRIALTRDVGLDENIDEWFLAQTLKILLQYYDPASRKFNNDNFPINLLEHLYSIADHGGRVVVEALKAKFMGNDDANLDPALMRAYSTIAFHYARSLNISFVFAIDGLDRLGRDEQASSRFEKLSQSVGRFLNAPARPGTAIIVAMRATSYAAFLHRYQGYGPDKGCIVVEVGTPAVADVTKKRIRAIGRMIEIGKFMGLNTHEMARAKILVNQFSEALGTAEFASEFMPLALNTAPNLRASMRTVAAAFLAAVTRSDRANSYKMIEYLLKARMSFPPIGYYVARDRKVRIADFAPAHKYDAVFSPLLFRPINISESNPAGSHGVSSFLKSMVLQLRLLQGLEGRKRTQIHTYAISINSRFGYEPGLIIAALDILENYHCIESIEEDPEQAGEIDDSLGREIYISNHGLNLLRDFCMDPAFLNLSVFRLPISDQAEKMGLVKFALLSHSNPVARTQSIATGLRNWTEAKIVNSLFLLGLLRAAITPSKDGRLYDMVQQRTEMAIGACVLMLIQKELLPSETDEIVAAIQTLETTLNRRMK